MFGNFNRENSFILVLGGLVLFLMFFSPNWRSFGLNSPGSTMGSNKSKGSQEKGEKTYQVLYTRTLGAEKNSSDKTYSRRSRNK